MNWFSCMCCPDNLNSREDEKPLTSFGSNDSMPPMQTISSLEEYTPERARSHCTTRNAPGADEQEDTKRLSVLLGHDRRMFQGYKQESSDSEEESTSDLDIERGNFPDQKSTKSSRIPNAPRASITTSLGDADMKRASIHLHEEGRLGWLDPQEFDDVFGTA